MAFGLIKIGNGSCICCEELKNLACVTFYRHVPVFTSAALANGEHRCLLTPQKGEINMSKGQDKKKESKKAPTKTLKEKRAEKKAKKG